MPAGFLERASEIAKSRVAQPAASAAKKGKIVGKKGKIVARAAGTLHEAGCKGIASTAARGSYTYAALGVTQCNFAIDLIANIQCVDLWHREQYWYRVGCGEWRTSANDNHLTGYRHRINCSGGRDYRAVSRWSVSHGSQNNAGLATAPYHECIA